MQPPREWSTCKQVSKTYFYLLMQTPKTVSEVLAVCKSVYHFGGFQPLQMSSCAALHNPNCISLDKMTYASVVCPHLTTNNVCRQTGSLWLSADCLCSTPSQAKNKHNLIICTTNCNIFKYILFFFLKNISSQSTMQCLLMNSNLAILLSIAFVLFLLGSASWTLLRHRHCS